MRKVKLKWNTQEKFCGLNENFFADFLEYFDGIEYQTNDPNCKSHIHKKEK